MSLFKRSTNCIYFLFVCSYPVADSGTEPSGSATTEFQFSFPFHLFLSILPFSLPFLLLFPSFHNSSFLFISSFNHVFSYSLLICLFSSHLLSLSPVSFLLVCLFLLSLLRHSAFYFLLSVSPLFRPFLRVCCALFRLFFALCFVSSRMRLT